MKSTDGLAQPSLRAADSGSFAKILFSSAALTLPKQSLQPPAKFHHCDRNADVPMALGYLLGGRP
jgi:hypothetical protein